MSVWEEFSKQVWLEQSASRVCFELSNTRRWPFQRDLLPLEWSKPRRHGWKLGEFWPYASSPSWRRWSQRWWWWSTWDWCLENVLQALPPMVDVKENPVTCNHSKVPSVQAMPTVGSQTACSCGLKWVWNDKVKKWEDRVLKDTQKNWIKRTLYGIAALAGNPPQQTIAASSQAALQATCKTKPTRSQEGIRSTQCPYNAPGGDTGPTSTRWNHHLDHLSEKPVPGSLQRDGAGTSIRPRAPELLRDGLLQRRDLQGRPPQDAARGRSEEMGNAWWSWAWWAQRATTSSIGRMWISRLMKSGKNQKDERQLAQISQGFGGWAQHLYEYEGGEGPTSSYNGFCGKLFGGRALMFRKLAHQYESQRFAALGSHLWLQWLHEAPLQEMRRSRPWDRFTSRCWWCLRLTAATTPSSTGTSTTVAGWKNGKNFRNKIDHWDPSQPWWAP